MNTPSHRHRGISLLFVAILLPVLIGLAGLAIDTCYVYFTYQRLQVTADAAALAAATQLPASINPRSGTPIPPHGFVYSYAEQVALPNFPVVIPNGSTTAVVALRPNDANADDANNDYDVVIGRYLARTASSQATFTASQVIGGSLVVPPYPNAVKIVARRDTRSSAGPLPLFFGPLFGITTVNMKRQAIAVINLPPTVVVLGGPNSPPNADQSLTISSGAVLSAPGGPVQVNSLANDAVNIVAGGGIRATALNIVGGITGDTSRTNTSGTMISLGVKASGDPLASLSGPSVPANNLSYSSGQPTVAPGHYPAGIALGSGSLFMQPGVYYLDGAGLRITGSASLTALGVMIYVHTGQLTLNSTGTILMTPNQSGNATPSSGLVSGLVIFQDRLNFQAATISGPGTLEINGALYLPAAALTVTGQGDTFGSEQIANTLTITGNVSLNPDGPIPVAQTPTTYLGQ